MLTEWKNPFVLAPLAGVTDSAFRRVCFEQGAAMAFTEMVSAKGLYYRNANTEDLLRIERNDSKHQEYYVKKSFHHCCFGRLSLLV